MPQSKTEQTRNSPYNMISHTHYGNTSH